LTSDVKLLAASGDLEFSIFLSNGNGTHLDAYLKERPEGIGLWVWDKNWRRPTSGELKLIFNGLSPFDEEVNDGHDE